MNGSGVSVVDVVLGPAFEALLVEFERDRERVLRAAGDRYWQAIMLARDLETCEALLRGEAVPVSRLDPVWMRRFGLRSSA